VASGSRRSPGMELSYQRDGQVRDQPDARLLQGRSRTWLEPGDHAAPQLFMDRWSLGLESGSVVVGWDSSAQAYAEQYVAGISPEFLDFGLLAGTSYFIYSQQAQTISLLGCSPEVFSQYSVNLLVPLLGGWTCVGFNTLGPGPCASEISDLVKGANVRIVCMYDPASSSYRTFIPGLTPLALDFTVDPGQGCWLWLDGAGR